TNVPKNILATSSFGGKLVIISVAIITIIVITLINFHKFHLVPMSEILKILVDRVYSIIIIISEEAGFQLAINDVIKKVFCEESIIGTYTNLFHPAFYPKNYKIYKQTAMEINADLFFCDIGMNFACFDFAWELKKPVVGFASTLLLTITPPPYKSDPTYGCHVNMENESFYKRFNCAIVKPLQFIWTFIKIGNQLNTQRAKLGVETYWNLWARMDNVLLLVNTFLGFEHCCHFKSCLQLINQNIIDGVVWTTLRTNVTELMSQFDVDFPISDILNNNYPHIHITKIAPQFAILSHENTKVFLSHGGASSSHESIYTATPMLILPIIGDQFGNAEKLELTGMALKLSKFNLTVDDIVLKIKRLLSEESFT
ncbi:14746_t:CDS:2, partial [Racocetra persica]